MTDTNMIVSKVWLDLILVLDTATQSKVVILKVSENKKQIIQLSFNDLVQTQY